MDTILIVDDVDLNRKILIEILKDKYHVHEACDGVQALEFIRANACTISLILLDIMMPNKDGYEVLRQIKQDSRTEHIPVILISALDSAIDESRGLSEGAIDYITKPFNKHIVKCRVDNHIRLKRYQDQLLELANQQAKEIVIMRESIFDAVTSIIEYRNLESGRHVKRIRLYCEAQLKYILEKGFYAWQIDSRDAELIARASSLHDIGKVSIPDRILTKPGPLTDDEMEIMKTHSAIGCDFIDIISEFGEERFLTYARQICRHHHEHWDGSGYPDGLAGQAIPLCARVTTIADVYDALVSRRVYKPSFSHEKAVSIILEEKGRLFDPELVDIFISIGDTFRAIAAANSD